MNECNCDECTCREARDHNTCDECHEPSRATVIVGSITCIVFFWHLIFFEFLAVARAKKELAKHPEKLIEAMFEAMTRGGAQ